MNNATSSGGGLKVDTSSAIGRHVLFSAMLHCSRIDMSGKEVLLKQVWSLKSPVSLMAHG